MKKLLLRTGTLCLLLTLAITGWAENVSATWNFAGSGATTQAAVALSGTNEAGTIEAEEGNGVLLTVMANGQTIRDNGNSIQTGNGVTFRVPVNTTKDMVTVVGYPGYFAYSIGGADATTATTEYKAKAADVEQGYVEIINKGQYIISIAVVQDSGFEEKTIYTTKFQEWDDLKASAEETVIDQQTRYSAEALAFTLYNINVNGGDTSIDLAGKFDNRPVGWLSYVKNGDSYVQTSPLASITSVRFVQGATGGNRGVKLEAKGDGDDDWVVISDAVANPAKWSEVNAEVNRTNCALRFTNLAPAQYAYIFELDIKGMVDMSKAPMLGTFKANGTEYVAGDIFEQDADGNYVATIELSKKATMISAENPLADVTADNGEVGDITYDATETACTVTIPVTANGQTALFIARFVQKPDFTLSYISPEDGQTVLCTQTVEKDAPIGGFAGDAQSNYGIPKGYTMRGWYQKPTGGRKYTVEDIVTSDLYLYGRTTEIETVSNSKKYVFNLADQYFYAEDHEAFNVTGTGKWHDSTHGWSFANGDQIELLVGPKATVSFTVCQYSAADSKLVAPDGTKLDARSASDGGVEVYNYEGEGGKLTFTVEAGGTIYIHSVKIVNTSETNYEAQGQWIIVKAGDAESFDSAIDAANSLNTAADAERLFIFVPDGIYDLKQTVLTTLSANNVSIIGQSQKGTVILNAPDKEDEGINKTATLVITGQNTYLQDLTLQNALDYYNSGSAGRAVALWDRGNRTICKNVTLLSYQDTYYSNNNAAQLYWETSDIHGTVDFICGGGDVRFQNTTLSLEPRKADGTGGRTITAPTTTTEFGYVFDGCKVVDLAEGKGEWNFGRTWQNKPVCIYLDTELDKDAEATIISSRWTEKGMNNTDPQRFGEYGTKSASGADITPESNKITSYGGQFETILTAEQAAAFSYDKMFTDWNPAALAAQVEAPAANFASGTVTWTVVDAATASALFKNGELVAILTDGETSYVIDANADTDALTIRSANAMGGLGEPVTVAGTATAISAAPATTEAEVIYNLQGQRVTTAQPGLYIVNGRKVIVK